VSLASIVFYYWRANASEIQNPSIRSILFQSAYQYAHVLLSIGLAFIASAIILRLFYMNRNKNREELGVGIASA